MSKSTLWAPAPALLSLQGGEIHVWRVDLAQPEDVVQQFRSTLEDDEIHRADRFHFEKDRRAFTVSRGFLRHVLGLYLATRPEALRFTYGPYGKPALNGEHKNCSLRFNMSHSRAVGLVAVTEAKELGVDVEYIRSDFASEDIARRFFSPHEVAAFNALGNDLRVAAFFRCWTRKEAYIKAIGRGLSQPLEGFDVTLAPEAPPALLRADEDDASRWSLSDIDVGSDYAAALVVEGRISEIRCWQ
ncbi:MAG TPA: 4'-phosphopantetheinyl transferase superfamily protein [Pyrinomonadaceae bacterium]|nr:4'-phosphopantetheinyl transferase superfamily protein [Pyrinomonadaceae bacterium]